MNESIKSTDVFTPNEFPKYTYVHRLNEFETQVEEGLRTPGLVVSVSGPSKSGKTVLVQRVAGKDNLIRVFGPQIKEADDLWTAVLDWMGSPATFSSQDNSGTGETLTKAYGGSLGIPKIVSVDGRRTFSESTSASQTRTRSYSRQGMSQVALEIGNSDFVVFLDDFHYMPRELQVQVAKHLKAAAELGIKSCVASVPHRSDDVVRANPELRGRVQAVDMKYWSNEELEKIGIQGFPFLNMDLSIDFIQKLSIESCGSPQLMQALCLKTCFHFKVYETLPLSKSYEPDGDDLKKILNSTSNFSDFSTMVEALHGGPKTHGTDRNTYTFSDGTTGDMYRAVMLALACDPPMMSIPYSELVARVKSVCVGASPSGRNVSDACEQISKIALKAMKIQKDDTEKAQAPIEWDKTTDPENMHIIEPYFLFYLRSSSKLHDLSQ